MPVLHLCPRPFALAAAFTAIDSHAQQRVGVLMLHGKNPGSNMAPNFSPSKATFEREGWLVRFPDMPWSRGRYLDGHWDKAMAEMAVTAPRVPAGTPVMTVIGEKDPLFKLTRSYYVDKLPGNPKSKYLEVSGGHLDTPRVASDEIVKWIKAAVAE